MRALRALVATVMAGLLAGNAVGVFADPGHRIVALGDSITRGVREGVKVEDTFCALLEKRLAGQGLSVHVINAGVGGERADQGLSRLETAVLSSKPGIALVMYGTNDSFIYPGTKDPDLPLARYRDSLVAMVARMRERGIQPVLMTPPRWGNMAKPNGIGEPHNKGLEAYVCCCREVARRLKVPLVDHFARWSALIAEGRDPGDWTTDQCHPNPRGHWEIAQMVVPALKRLLADQATHWRASAPQLVAPSAAR